VLELSERSYRRGVHQALHVAAEIAAKKAAEEGSAENIATTLYKMSDIAGDLRSNVVRTKNNVLLLGTILEQLNASEK